MIIWNEAKTLKQQLISFDISPKTIRDTNRFYTKNVIACKYIFYNKKL